MSEILVVDDEMGIRELLSEILQDEGHQVRLAENADQARCWRGEKRPDLVLLDIWMPDTDGITLLKEWAGAGLLTMPVIMMSGHATIDTAVEATRIGAFDFLEKPIALSKLLATIGQALAQGEAVPSRVLSLASLGKSPIIAQLKQRLEQITNLKSPVLLTGEPGCGAELCARFLHRPPVPYVAPDSHSVLVDSPLALLDEAKEGALYLSEIGNLNRLEQKGLALLVGKLDKYNVRLICATSRLLPERVSRDEFDAALFQALSQVMIGIPSLREHREDIPELVNVLLTQAIEAGEAPVRKFATAALNALRNHDWPGNLRQLENVVKTLALTSLDEEIGAEEVARVLSQFDSIALSSGAVLPLHLDYKSAKDAFERLYLEYHIARENGNMSRVAEKVGLERTHLYRKLKQLGVRTGRRSEEPDPG
jgi:two-component system, NtrC family, nitrogen regulation response regulator NtrX